METTVECQAVGSCPHFRGFQYDYFTRHGNAYFQEWIQGVGARGAPAPLLFLESPRWCGAYFVLPIMANNAKSTIS